MSTQVLNQFNSGPQQFPELKSDFDEPDVTQTGSQPVAAVVQEPARHVDVAAKLVCCRCGHSEWAVGYIVDYGNKFEQIHSRRSVSLCAGDSISGALQTRGGVSQEARRSLPALADRDARIDPEELRRAERPALMMASVIRK